MDTIRVDGRNVEVEEVARPSNWHCRIVKTVSGDAYYFEHFVSTGPYKIDLPYVHPFSGSQFAAYQAGQLDLAAFARELEGKILGHKS